MSGQGSHNPPPASSGGNQPPVTPPLAPSPDPLANKKEAIKTYIEQTKLLITLASAFIIAPAVVFKDLANVDHGLLVWMEVFFVASVLASYVVMGAITGTQNIGQYDVNRPAIRIASFFQLGLYLIGVAIFISGLLSAKGEPTTKSAPKTDTVKVQPIINNTSIHNFLPCKPKVQTCTPSKHNVITKTR